MEGAMKDLFLKLISATRGSGPSSTRLIYMLNGLAAVFCAVVSTLGGMIVYCAARRADAIYWGAVAALWTATLGFSAQTKRTQTKVAEAIAAAPKQEVHKAPVLSIVDRRPRPDLG
jgi:hypothetical protein